MASYLRHHFDQVVEVEQCNQVVEVYQYGQLFEISL